MSRDRFSLGAAVLLVTCIGCGPVQLPGLTDATGLELDRADEDALQGRPREAYARYEAIVRDHPNDPAAAEALHRMAMLRVEAGSPLRDRRTAQLLFRRLATDYGTTLSGREARAWRVLLREIDRCEAEATRRGADAEKLRQTLDSIRDSDLELEQHP
jgi:hypothetical protein